MTLADLPEPDRLPVPLKRDAIVPDPGETDLLASLRLVAMAMEQAAEQYRDDPVALAAGAARLETIVRDFSHLLREWKRRTSELMKAQRVGRFTIESVAVVAQGGSNQRSQWRHRDLAEAVMASVARENEGEVPGRALLDALLDCAGISYWKVEPCQARGIDVNDYCLREWVPTVQFPDNRTA